MQTVYTLYNSELQLGNIADTSLRQVDSFSAEGVVGLAKFVRAGTNPERQCVQLTTSVGQAALAIGVALLTQTLVQNSAGLVQYADKETVSVMTKGRVVLQTNDAVAARAQANLHLASGNVTDEAVGAGIEAFTRFRARFVTATTAAGLAIVEISDMI
jgi:hypothetical protein